MDQIIDRVKKILMTPADALNEVKTEVISIVDLIKNYVAIIAAIPALAAFLGMISYAPFFDSLFSAILMYVLGLAFVFLFGKVIDLLASYFSSTRNDTNSFKLAVYAFTPAFIAGIFKLIPVLDFVSLLGSLYGIYIFYLGLPILMETPEDKRIIYTIASIVVMFVAMLVLTSIVGALTCGGVASYRY